MRSGRSDVSWFLRAARVVPVIAGAALVGGMIGGFAMFAIDSALTWEPNPQSRSDARADNQASAVNSPAAQTTTPQTTKPVRIVGGAIPDPSAGMSAPPPVQSPGQQQQQRSTSAQSHPQLPPQLLTPTPLGPASQLQQQTATTTTPAPAPGTPPPNQSANQPQAPKPVQTQKAAPNTVSSQEQTHWPDALSRAHQNAATTQQQTPPSSAAPPAAAGTPPATAQTSEPAGKESNQQTTANTNDQDHASESRHSRQSRRHASRHSGSDQPPGAEDSSRRQQARSYDRLYDSYGNRRDRSSGNAREQFYGDRDDQNDAASQYDRDTRSQYGRDRRNRGRSRATGRQPPDEGDRTQANDSPRARPEPFWGGGFFRRGYQDDGY